MNCREFWNTLPETGSANPHLAECADCSARMRRMEQLQAGMRALAGDMAPVEAPARVEAQLLSAFRAHSGLPRVTPVRRRTAVLTWAAAFAAMLAVGLFLMRNRTDEAVRPQPAPARMQLASIELSAIPESALEEGYLPLPGAAQLAPADDVSVVHVELPRAAMMQVGIEVSPDRADEPVLADVMLGSDGMARAVRFVDVRGSDD